MADMKPCPFCGESLIAHDDQSDLFVQRYGTIYRHSETDCYLSLAKIIPSEREAWNTRTSGVQGRRVRFLRWELAQTFLGTVYRVKDERGEWVADFADREAVERFCSTVEAPSDRAAELDKLLTQILNRRVTIEQRMFDAAAGKRAMPTPDELRQWAAELGTPRPDGVMGKEGEQR